MRKNQNNSIHREGSLDSFQIELKTYRKSKPLRQSKRITEKKQSENLKHIKMSRGASAPKAKFTITDIKRENYPDLSVETLKKAIKHFVSSRPEKMQKNNPEMKKLHMEYDNYGHLSPHEPYHRLNSADMKEINTFIEETKSKLEKIIINQKCDVENIGLKILSLYGGLSSNVLSKLSEDALSRCEFVGDLFNFTWQLISSLLCKILELVNFSNNQSKTILKESMNDMKLFSKKYEELSKKQPVVIEKEVFIESPSMMNSKEQQQRAQLNLEASMNRTKEVQRKLNIENKSKEAWKSASIDLCKLSSPSTIILFDKQNEWSKLGQSYIDICHSKVKDIIEISKEVTRKWNEECLEVYSLTYKSQSTLLVHLNSIYNSCSEISRTLTDDYNLYHSGKVRQPEAYQKALTNGKLQKISENLLAWSVVVEQWMELEYNELINEARNITLNLDDDFQNFVSLIENSVVKKHFPSESINELRSLHQRVTTILKRITMPINDQTKLILKPIHNSFKEWGKLISEAVEGKQNRVLLSNGYIDPMSMIIFVRKLDEDADTLQKFTQRRIEEIQELQMSLPSFTTDIVKICDDLTQHISASLESLQNMLDENVEIALAWSLLYGAGVQGPFSLQKNQLLKSDFERTYRAQFENWMNLLKSDFDEVIHEKAFEQFELFLNDWFATAKNCVLQKCQFYYSAQVQTDPISIEMKLSKSDNSLSSSSGMLPTVMRTDTCPEFECVIQLTNCETLFEIKPFILNDHFILPHKRMKDFSKKSLSLYSNAHPNVNSAVSVSSNILPSQPPAYSKSSTSKKNSGKVRPLAWLLSIMAELCDFRLSTVSKTKVGNTSLFYNPTNMATCFVNFLRTKYGVKAKMSKFTNDFETTIYQFKNLDPTIYALNMFITGGWSSYCFDFYLMCRSILPKSATFNYSRFAELVFSTFGDMPTFSVLSALQLYEPKNNDEFLIVLASSFSSVLASRRNESLALFNSNCTLFGAKNEDNEIECESNESDSKSGIQLVTISSFIRLASSINPIGSIETYRRVCHSIISCSLTDENQCHCQTHGKSSKGKTKGKNSKDQREQQYQSLFQQGLTFDQFEVALLYCALFSQPNIALNPDPFALLPEIVFGEIKRTIVAGENRKALTQLSRLISTMVREMQPNDSAVLEIIKHELRVSQIIMRKEIIDQLAILNDEQKSDMDEGENEGENQNSNENDKMSDTESKSSHFKVKPPKQSKEEAEASSSTKPFVRSHVRVSSQVLPNEDIPESP
ncbi:hypothetical protein M9Y10_023322 [Tritrichomonas musculus]|uniref:Uncharacterized protein n=1 Tax=Tritrichomonas musculus TaxID=1915356 RepID=A0ABR2KVF6_9EUKA